MSSKTQIEVNVWPKILESQKKYLSTTILVWIGRYNTVYQKNIENLMKSLQKLLSLSCN